MFFLACFSLILMAIHITLDIVLRQLGIFIQGTLEVTSFYYMVISIFLSFSYTQYTQKHIVTDVLINLFSKKIKKLFFVFGLLIQLIFYSILSYQTLFDAYYSTIQKEQTMANFSFYIWPSKWALPIGFISVLLIVILQLINTLSEKDTSNG